MEKSDHLTNKKLYIHISTRPVVTKPDGIVAYDEDPKVQSQMFFLSHGHMRSCDKKHDIFVFARPIVTKLDRMMVYDKGSPRRETYLTNSVNLYFYKAHGYQF